MNKTKVIQRIGTNLYSVFLSAAMVCLGYGITSYQWWVVVIPSITLVSLFYTPDRTE